MEACVFLSIGSNVGNRVENCRRAVEELGGNNRIRLISVSSLYETEPIGYEDQPLFINLAVKIETTLTPSALLQTIKTIERKLGRVETFRWGPRIIDIDIIIYDNLVISDRHLVLPHPRMQERAYVLIPLLELDKNLKHTVTGKTLDEMIKELPNNKSVRKLENEEKSLEG